MRKYKPVPWPVETRVYYQEMFNELLRIRAMAETCIAEYEIDNPFIFEALFPHIGMRSRHVAQAGKHILSYVPQEKGHPPKWGKITRRIVRISSVIDEVLDGPEMVKLIKGKWFPALYRTAQSVLQASRYMQEQMEKVPLEQARLVLKQSGYIELELVEDKVARRGQRR